MEFAEGIVGNSGQKVRDVILRGQEEGWSIRNMAKALTQVFSDFDKTRATMIARTETIRSNNAAALASYKQAGIARFQWYAAQDERVCPFCNELHVQYGPGTEGQVIGQVFFEEGESMEVLEEQLVFSYEPIYQPPLHPNCRCSVLPVIEYI